jgi:hypothetical protein
MVNTIGRLPGDGWWGGFRQWGAPATVSLQRYQLPEANLFNVPNSGWNRTNILIADLLGRINEIRTNFIQYRFGLQLDQESGPDYSDYLQFPNRKIAQLAQEIVAPGDSNDEKAEKILQWVLDHIEYRSDLENYGAEEYWAYPTLTLSRQSGDCEDGAFLIHSLMLHARIPPTRIMTYGGYVIAGEGASTGGHGWTVYRRETDDEWVVLDWSYYPSRTPVAERMPMREDGRYIDDYFYVSLLGTVQTPFTNKVRNPQAVGRLVDVYA